MQLHCREARHGMLGAERTRKSHDSEAFEVNYVPKHLDGEWYTIKLMFWNTLIMDWGHILDILAWIKSRKFRKTGALLRFVNSLIFAHKHNLTCQGQVGFQAYFHWKLVVYCSFVYERAVFYWSSALWHPKWCSKITSAKKSDVTGHDIGLH